MDVLTKIIFNGENIKEEIIENTSLQFLWACEEGNLDKVSEILNDPKNEHVIESTNELNQNGFHLACSNGRYNIVDLLLKTVNMTAPRSHGLLQQLLAAQSTLRSTKINSKTPVVNIDIINATDKLNHQTGIHLACVKGYFDIVKLLLSDHNVDM